MRITLLLSCMWALTIVSPRQGSAAPPDAPKDAKDTAPVQLILELSDGSRLIGTPSIDKLKITTQYASMDVTLAQFRAVEFSGDNHAVKATLQNGDLLNGRFDAKEIGIKTLFGPVTIPFAQVRRMRVSTASKAMPEGLVLHYTFDVDEGDKITDSSDSGNNGTSHGATFSNEGKSGGAISLNGDHAAIVVPDSASLHLQDFTIMA